MRKRNLWQANCRIANGFTILESFIVLGIIFVLAMVIIALAKRNPDADAEAETSPGVEISTPAREGP